MKSIVTKRVLQAANRARTTIRKTKREEKRKEGGGVQEVPYFFQAMDQLLEEDDPMRGGKLDRYLHQVLGFLGSKEVTFEFFTGGKEGSAISGFSRYLEAMQSGEFEKVVSSQGADIGETYEGIRKNMLEYFSEKEGVKSGILDAIDRMITIFSVAEGSSIASEKDEEYIKQIAGEFTKVKNTLTTLEFRLGLPLADLPGVKSEKERIVRALDSIYGPKGAIAILGLSFRDVGYALMKMYNESVNLFREQKGELLSNINVITS